MKLLENANNIIARYQELEKTLNEPNIEVKKMIELSKYKSDLEELYETSVIYKKTADYIQELKATIEANEDKELTDLSITELHSTEHYLDELTNQFERMLLPKDPDDKKNVILEIRAGTGGDEAALFGMDLLNIYRKFAERKGWKFEIMDIDKTGIDGLKDCVVLISGKNVYSEMKYESGTHRVQRVPETENNGRVHTSAVTVAILPEVEDIDVNIRNEDLVIETCRASGAGGQHVNKTDSAIRITHTPTGITVFQQEDRSQIKNKEKALKLIKSKVYDLEKQKAEEVRSKDRKTQVGSGDRSEKIRTYNFPQNRITDHRIGFVLHKLDIIIKEGCIDEIITALKIDSENKKIASMQH